MAYKRGMAQTLRLAHTSRTTEEFMEQHDEKPLTEYPRGRGYGHDYMRGGEVFGGYGYSEREEYERPRGAAADGEPAAALVEEEPSRTAHESADESSADDATESHSDQSASARSDGAPPVPQLEQAYGSTGGNLRHSRSFYVTQAQLQQRIYGPLRYGRGPYHQRLRTLERDDGDIKRDVEERLFFDTWVDAQRIVVGVEDGVVTLSGTLPSYEEIRYACDDAWEVAGVRGVHSELRVEEGGGTGARPGDAGDAA